MSRPNSFPRLAALFLVAGTFLLTARGEDPTDVVKSKQVAEMEKQIADLQKKIADLKSPSLTYSSDPAALKAADFYIVTVPTPVDENLKPDLSAMLAASETVGRVLKKGTSLYLDPVYIPPCAFLSGHSLLRKLAAAILDHLHALAIRFDALHRVMRETLPAAQSYGIMQELARQGACVIVVSSELPEVLGVSDRIAVMRQGKIAAILDRADANEEKLLKLALPLETARAS